jgi:hypothetical protein
MRLASARAGDDLNLAPQIENCTMEQKHNRLTVGDGVRFGIGFVLAPLLLWLAFVVFGSVIIPNLLSAGR